MDNESRLPIEERTVGTMPEASLVQNKSPLSKATVLILALLLVLSVAYGVYAFMQINQQNAEISKLKSENEALNTLPKAKPVETKTFTEDKQVEASFTNYCDRYILQDGYERDYTIGTMTTEQKRFIYSSDKKFVAFNGGCFAKPVGSVRENGGAALFIFKKVNENWLMIVITQQRPMESDIIQYGIPEEFLTTLGLGQ
jgi:hypothetical protein